MRWEYSQTTFCFREPILGASLVLQVPQMFACSLNILWNMCRLWSHGQWHKQTVANKLHQRGMLNLQSHDANLLRHWRPKLYSPLHSRNPGVKRRQRSPTLCDCDPNMGWKTITDSWALLAVAGWCERRGSIRRLIRLIDKDNKDTTAAVGIN